MSDLTRRDFVKTTGLALGAAGLPASAAFAMQGASGPRELRVLQLGTQGMGGVDRKQVEEHPRARIVGLCDVDTNRLRDAQREHPDAFVDTDYRRIFADRADEFDAVIVSVPDHQHAPMMLMALAHDKHCYGQKPLVQQVEELVMVERAIAAKPNLVTQTGNQRMMERGRRAAVEILRQGQLGKAKSAHVWTGSVQGRASRPRIADPSDPPAHLDWDLWLGPAEVAPYRQGIDPGAWRNWWEYGTAGLGDWGVHMLDIILYSYDELTSPIAVMTHTPRAASNYHTAHCRSTTTYDVSASDKFTGDTFPIHYCDSRMADSRAAHGIPGDAWASDHMTVISCEGGTLVLTVEGKLEIWRGGEMTEGWRMPDLPEFGFFNHWHAWVDQCLGIDSEVWTPFSQAVRITEPALLAVKASRFPGRELHWDRASLTFTNHQEATDTVLRRTYRDGFAPPVVG
ncbi:MAG: Gfo/Idh/MocA family protein [Phycisphaerales bacterium JB063]